MIQTFHIFQIFSVYSAKNKKSVYLSIIHVGAVARQKKKKKKMVKEKHGTWIWRLILGIAYYVIAMDVWDLKLQKVTLNLNHWIKKNEKK